MMFFFFMVLYYPNQNPISSSVLFLENTDWSKVQGAEHVTRKAAGRCLKTITPLKFNIDTTNGVLEKVTPLKSDDFGYPYQISAVYKSFVQQNQW